MKALRGDSADNEQQRAYLLEVLDSGLSASYARQAWAALVVVYEKLLRQPKKVTGLPSAKGYKRVPVVLSREKVNRLLGSVMNKINWTFLLPEKRNNYTGSKIALIFLILWALVGIVRGCIHVFAPDGGAGTIAGFDLAADSPSALVNGAF